MTTTTTTEGSGAPKQVWDIHQHISKLAATMPVAKP